MNNGEGKRWQLLTFKAFLSASQKLRVDAKFVWKSKQFIKFWCFSQTAQEKSCIFIQKKNCHFTEMRILNVHKNILISYAHKDLSIFCMYSNLSYSLAAQWIFTMQTREAPLYRNSIIAALWSHKLDKHIMGKWLVIWRTCAAFSTICTFQPAGNRFMPLTVQFSKQPKKKKIYIYTQNFTQIMRRNYVYGKFK